MKIVGTTCMFCFSKENCVLIFNVDCHMFTHMGLPIFTSFLIRILICRPGFFIRNLEFKI